ncbi:peptidase M24 [Pelagivirga sediminicola]|uniref:Peptidase M24 n=1 Tax=Pelagivirga sediminicola TaxID=2170575 RepID=A0A2T7GBL0_9RHOB|nr:Xaa-Pro peptidase family protein [Pelagivirga sediminicola]PVA11801.1 peptidase M24 [Pelagivirga sediminicola]
MTRGFAPGEFQARVAAAQARMAAAGLGALLLTTEPDVRYFTGFLTRFWESPSRPWFLVLPASGAPIAVIPSIGAALMAQTWIEDIRVWPAPDPEDDGISLLAATLREVGGQVGVPSGPESYLRMPLNAFAEVKAASGLHFARDHGIVAALRAVKSEAEIAKIAHACAIAGRAFDRVGEIAREGVPLSAVFRDFQRLLLQEGADLVAYIAGGAGPDGYGDVISPATDAPLARGDVLMLDTGAVWDGYFCDFDRNYAVGAASGNAALAHAQLAEAVETGCAAARPGARACDVHAAMAAIIGAGEGAGRLGHGLGMQLTEGLSLIPQDRTVLEPGMVITLEPGVTTGPGTIVVAEENIVIRDGAAQRLTRFAGPALPAV